MARFQPPGRPRRPSSPETDPDDDFLARLLILSAWARRNSQTLILVAVVAVIGVVGAIYYVGGRSGARTQAVLELEQIQQAVEMGEREGVFSELERFLGEHRRSPAAHEARLLLGELHLERGDVEAAIVALEPSLGSLRNPVAVQSALLLGTAYETAERWNDAEDAYLRVAARTRMDFQLREALGAAARLRAERGDLAGAAELYREVLETFEDDDPERGLYAMRLAEVEVRRDLN